MGKAKDSALKFTVLLGIGLVTVPIGAKLMNLVLTPAGWIVLTGWVALASALIVYGYRNRPWLSQDSNEDVPAGKFLPSSPKQDHEPHPSGPLNVLAF